MTVAAFVVVDVVVVVVVVVVVASVSVVVAAVPEYAHHTLVEPRLPLPRLMIWVGGGRSMLLVMVGREIHMRIMKMICMKLLLL